MSKLMIVTADDLGLDHGVNMEIIRVHRTGLVRCASMIVNMPSSAEASILARNESALEVGLHLNVTEGACLAPVDRVALLAHPNGSFRFAGGDPGTTLLALRRCIGENQELIAQILLEFSYQVERFVDLGLPLTHLTAHHFVPLIHPRVYEAYVHFAESVGVPYRGICEPIVEVLDVPEEEREGLRLISKNAGIASPSLSITYLLDTDDSIHVSPNQYCRKMEWRLRELAARDDLSSLELVTHPAPASERHPHGEHYGRARELETWLVQSAELRRAAEAMGYHLGSYSCLLGGD